MVHSPPPSPEQVQQRTGASSTPKSGEMHSLVFFGLIIVVVGGLGLLGVAIWGPEKESKTSRSQYATNPPPSVTLPSLPPEDPPPAPAVATPAESASSEPAGSSTAKKGKKGVHPRGGGKKH